MACDQLCCVAESVAGNAGGSGRLEFNDPPLAIRLRASQSFREKSRQVSDITAIKKMREKRAFEFHLRGICS
jgi:hypothetical protein